MTKEMWLELEGNRLSPETLDFITAFKLNSKLKESNFLELPNLFAHALMIDVDRHEVGQKFAEIT